MTDGRKCPECGGKTKIIDSRDSNLPGTLTRRRVKCLECGFRGTTIETWDNGPVAKASEVNAIVFADRVSVAISQIIRELYPDLTSDNIGTIRRRQAVFGEETPKAPERRIMRKQK